MMKKYFKIIIPYFLLALVLVSFSFVSQADVSDPDPIIIIPGIGASWNWDVMMNNENSNDWDFLTGVHNYDNLIQALEDEGFEKDKDTSGASCAGIAAGGIM